MWQGRRHTQLNISHITRQARLHGAMWTHTRTQFLSAPDRSIAIPLIGGSAIWGISRVQVLAGANGLARGRRSRLVVISPISLPWNADGTAGSRSARPFTSRPLSSLPTTTRMLTVCHDAGKKNHPPKTTSVCITHLEVGEQETSVLVLGKHHEVSTVPPNRQNKQRAAGGWV